jgi:hypothetical protein
MHDGNPNTLPSAKTHLQANNNNNNNNNNNKITIPDISLNTQTFSQNIFT